MEVEHAELFVSFLRRCLKTPPEFRSLPREFFRGKGKRPGFFFIHLPEHRKHSPDVPVMLGSDEKL